MPISEPLSSDLGARRDVPGRAERPPSLPRLWLVELRKVVDTPSGIVLVGVAALLTGVFGGGAVLFRDAIDFGGVARMAAVPGATLLPVLAILLVTAERSHRTALTTYALVPRRGLVLTAKAAAVVTLSVAVPLLSLLAAALITPVGAAVVGHPVPWTVDWVVLAWFTAGVVAGGLSGLALALLIGNAPATIVIVLVWPMLASFLGMVPGAVAVLAWLDVAAVSGFADGADGPEVARALAGVAAWVVLPGVIGWIRTVRSEVRS